MNNSQALRRIKVLKGQISAWEKRASESNIVAQDENPTYTFDECVENRAKAVAELLDLGARVAVANATCILPCKMPISRAIRKLDNIKAEIAWLRTLPVLPIKEIVEKRTVRAWDTVEKTQIYVEVPHKKACTMDARAVQRKLDELQAEFDALNSEVETANNSVNI